MQIQRTNERTKELTCIRRRGRSGPSCGTPRVPATHCTSALCGPPPHCAARADPACSRSHAGTENTHITQGYTQTVISCVGTHLCIVRTPKIKKKMVKE